MVATRDGVRYRPAAELTEMRTHADESHPDQTLASLLELGLPLRSVLTLGDASSTLHAVLDDLVAGYYLQAREAEWTAVALALALPPQRSWQNRFGESTSFDALAEHLIEKPFDQVSCGGTHVFYALVVLLGAHRQAPVLSPGTESRLVQRIATLTQRVVEHQRPDGSWDMTWDGGGAPRHPSDESVTARLLVTGHLGECLLRLPDALRPGDEVLRRAGAWLWPVLRDGVRGDAFHAQFCPYTHAACVVQALRRCPNPRPATSVGRVSPRAKEHR